MGPCARRRPDVPLAPGPRLHRFVGVPASGLDWSARLLRVDWISLLCGIGALGLAIRTTRDQDVQSPALRRWLVGGLGVCGAILVVAGFTG